MALVKTSSRFAKKQAPAAGAQASGTRKPMTGKKGKGALKPAGSKSQKKGSSKSAAKYSSLKSRQIAVQAVKRSIWAALQQITKALIDHATMGNLSTAKELFDFAGVYSLPMPDDENATSAVLPIPAQATKIPAAGAPAAEAPAPHPAPVHPIDLFFKKIGIEPSTAEPEPEVA